MFFSCITYTESWDWRGLYNQTFQLSIFIRREKSSEQRYWLSSESLTRRCVMSSPPHLDRNWFLPPAHHLVMTTLQLRHANLVATCSSNYQSVQSIKARRRRWKVRVILHDCHVQSWSFTYIVRRHSLITFSLTDCFQSENISSAVTGPASAGSFPLIIFLMLTAS